MFVAADAITAKVPSLPESPGVYLWKDADGVVLYVGKAKRLRSRVRSYINGEHRESPKTRLLMHNAADVETIVVPTEAHALVLEATLIKEYHPRFNIALRDDKSYPYIKVTVQEPFPRVYVTRRLESDGARYFGPYTDVAAMRRALNVVKRIFTVRSCNYDMPKSMPERACLDYHIGRCKAPCILMQTQEEYCAMIDEVVLFLEGRTDEVVRRVGERMAEAAEKLDFARDGIDAVVAILRVRDGKLLAREHHFLDHVEDEPDATVLYAYLARTYLTLEERVAELLVPFDFDDRELFTQSVAPTRVHVPQRGPRREIIDLAQQNARHLLEEARMATEETTDRAGDPVYELQRELSLQRVPRAIVCFDISHAQGTDTVASCVWFQNGRPHRAEYRKFKIKTVVGIDDFASMNEVVSRFIARRVEERKALPDLVVIDGGKGQLNAARAALDAQGIALPIISLAKREEEIFVPGRTDSVRLSRRSPALRLLQQVRDEAHRFAVTFQRQRRAARTVTSELLSIPGVGPSKRGALIRAFGSVQGVRSAGAEAIAQLPGFSLASAQRILASLAESDPTKTTELPAPAIAGA